MKIILLRGRKFSLCFNTEKYDESSRSVGRQSNISLIHNPCVLFAERITFGLMEATALFGGLTS